MELYVRRFAHGVLILISSGQPKLRQSTMARLVEDEI